MTAMTPQEVLKELDAGKRPQVFLLSGDELLSHRTSEAIVDRLLKRRSPGFNYVVMEAVSAGAVAEELLTIPMFRGPKVVVVKEPDFLMSRKGRGGGNDLSKAKTAWDGGKKRLAANRALILLGKAGMGVGDLLEPDLDRIRDELDVDLTDEDAKFLRALGEFCQEERITAPDGGTQPLEDLMDKGIPRDHALVIETSQLDGLNAFVKRLKKEGVFVEQKVEQTLRKLDIHDLCAEILAPLDKVIDSAAEQLLKNLCGGNTRVVQGELEKLATYVGDERRNIRVEDVRLLVRRVREEEYTELSDALSQKRFRDVLRYVEVALEQGDAALKIHGAVASCVRNLLELRLFFDSKGASSRIAQRDFENRFYPMLQEMAAEKGRKAPHPYVAWLNFQACQRFQTTELVRALSAVADADVELKSGGQPRQSLTRMVIRMFSRT